MQAILVALGKRSFVEIEWPNDMDLDGFADHHGFGKLAAYKSELLVLNLFQREAAPRFMVDIDFEGTIQGEVVLCATQLDVIEIIGKVRTFSPIEEIV